METAAHSLPQVGVAIERPALREAVSRTLARSLRYWPMDAADARSLPPAGGYVAMVTTPAGLRKRTDSTLRARRSGCPVIVIVEDGERMDDATGLDAADGILSAAKVATLLPAAIVLSAHRMSVVPDAVSHPPPGAALVWK